MEWLSEHFEIIWRATRTGRAAGFSFDGPVRLGSTNLDEQRRAPARAPGIKLLIGGHGKNYTFRLAARYCDELNLNVFPDEVPALLEVFGSGARRSGATRRRSSSTAAPTRSCATRT